jgi:hypothetical protein
VYAVHAGNIGNSVRYGFRDISPLGIR